MALVHGGPLARKDEEVPAVEGDQDATLCSRIAQLVFVFRSKITCLLGSAAIDPAFAQHNGHEGVHMFVEVEFHVPEGTGA